MNFQADDAGIAQYHKPVLLRQVIEALDPRPGGRYLDCTAGLGGHSQAILETAPDSALCALDRDREALALCRKRLERFEHRVHFFNLPFSRFEEALAQLGWQSVDGVLVDLGVSSLQLDDAGRGFSFHAAGPLDMRMDDRSPVTAAAFVNTASREEIRNCIATLGEEPLADSIARQIVSMRGHRPFTNTLELAGAVLAAYPAKRRREARRHPATRTFQALRMLVNDELGELERFLAHILPSLAEKGRLCIISFHSLEDRLVKNKFRQWAAGCLCPPHTLQCTCNHRPEVRILYRKPLCADSSELADNPRASSAHLRAVEKIQEFRDDYP